MVTSTFPHIEFHLTSPMDRPAGTQYNQQKIKEIDIKPKIDRFYLWFLYFYILKFD